MSENKSFKGIERGRAGYAYKCAKDGSNLSQRDEYKSYVNNIPVYIKTNGLGAALAFVNAKREEDKTKRGYAYEMIYVQTFEYLQKFVGHIVDFRGKNKNDMIKEIISLNSAEYRSLTIESLAFFIWLRRFVNGLIKEDKQKIEEPTNA